ncbi:MAG: GAF domain-containing protein, partial [Acidimicrobiales bacterium]
MSRGDDEAAGVVAAGIVAALGVILSARQARERRRARDRKVTEDALAALEEGMDPALSSLPVAGLLDEVLTRTKEALSADFTCVLVRGMDHRRLEVRAAAGPLELAAPGMERSPGPGVLQSVARHSGPFLVDAPLGRHLAPSDAAARAMSSLAACPLLVDGRLLGILVAGAPEPARFDAPGLRLLGIAGERIATALERSRLDEAERRSRLASDHAHLHLRVLARAGAVLGTALDSYDTALRSLGDAVVPDFADWFAVDVLKDGGIRRMTASWSARGVTVTRSPSPSRPVPSPHPSLDQLVRLALAEMQPQLLADTDRLRGALLDARVHRPEDVKGMTTSAANVDSIVVVPVRLGETFNGALSFVRKAGRRGYRPSDVEVARELVDRVAVAIERVAAWRESHRAAAAARHHAERLGELVESSLVMNAQLGEGEVLELLAERAHRVLDAAVVAVTAMDADGLAVDAQWPPAPPAGPAGPAGSATSRRAVRREAAIARATEAVLRSGCSNRHSPNDGPGWIAVPVADTKGATERVVVAMARGRDVLDDEDESVLTLLTQMASVALQNARLYAR